ncbi:hypothetical protein [Actinoplanes sp. NPDC049802]|uniref:hypothetical protein n=1 Tax=Actinoplanes sp. NPDC049802 TaxID=3154742 RepID=UPI0033EB2A75
MSLRRGLVYRVPPVDREFLVISIDTLNEQGTAIVVEVTDDKAWSDSRNLLAVPFGPDDLPAGRSALAWRVNHLSAARLTDQVGGVGGGTLNRVIHATKAAIGA